MCILNFFMEFYNVQVFVILPCTFKVPVKMTLSNSQFLFLFYHFVLSVNVGLFDFTKKLLIKSC